MQRSRVEGSRAVDAGLVSVAPLPRRSVLAPAEVRREVVPQRLDGSGERVEDLGRGVRVDPRADLWVGVHAMKTVVRRADRRELGDDRGSDDALEQRAHLWKASGRR